MLSIILAFITTFFILSITPSLTLSIIPSSTTASAILCTTTSSSVIISFAITCLVVPISFMFVLAWVQAWVRGTIIWC